VSESDEVFDDEEEDEEFTLSLFGSLVPLFESISFY